MCTIILIFEMISIYWHYDKYSKPNKYQMALQTVIFLLVADICQTNIFDKRQHLPLEQFNSKVVRLLLSHLYTYGKYCKNCKCQGFVTSGQNICNVITKILNWFFFFSLFFPFFLYYCFVYHEGKKVICW